MDPTTMMNLMSYLFGGGQGAGAGGGGAGQPGTPGMMAPTPPVPNVAGSAAGQGVGPAGPEDVSPMPVPQPPQPGFRMPTRESLTGMLPERIQNMVQSSPMMPSTGGVPYQNAQPPTSLGEALQPATPVPTPMPRPPGLGLGQGSQGYYGGSPETNPNLRPQGGPTTPRPPIDIAKMLEGVKKPAVDVVKPSTPAAPQMRAPGNSELLQLLQMLGSGRSMRGPTTLGQALDNKPSAWGGIYG